jgi:similar to stage IV sporulation protein
MLAIKIWNYLKGYVIIRIEGLALERLLNLALTNDIYLWDVKRLNHYQVEVCVSPKGLDNLLELVKKLGCKEEILEEKGLPFILERIKRRKPFVAGFMFFLFLIFFLSAFIWKIEVNGLEQTPKDKVLQYLESNGISSSKPKMSISEEEVELLLLNEFDYFSFIEVQKKGVKLVIEIKEEPLPPEMIDREYPTNVIAEKKGVITKVVARNGDALVKEGQIVNQGQVLISGAMLTNEQEVYLVHAEGEVYARTRYEATVSEPIIKRVEKETGRVFEQKGVKINKRGIKFIKDIPFANYKEYIREEKIFDWSIIDIPLKLITYEYREIEVQEARQNIESVKQSNQLKAIEEINEKLADDVEIIARDVKHEIDGNIVNTTVIVEAIEEIGKKVIIGD